MRRKDREITDFQAILKIIDGCDILRLGLSDGDFPYIVPLNFAYQVQDGQLALYVHGAMAGRKYELMKRNRKCSFEMDIPLEMDCVYEDKEVTMRYQSVIKEVTMRYQSVMGTARIDFLEGEEKQEAIDHILMGRYPETRNFDYNRSMVPHTAVAKLTVLELTAKANPIRVKAD